MARSSSPLGLRFLVLLAAVRIDVAACQLLGRLRHGHASDAVDPFTEALLREVDRTFGGKVRSFVEKRVVTIEESLRVAYSAVPHNEHGKLGRAAAGYVLHRHFLRNHAWLVSGLDPDCEAMAGFSSSSIIEILKGHVPDRIVVPFEDLAVGPGGWGLGLSDLAVVAAILEYVIHEEAIQRLRVTYEALDFSTIDMLNSTQTESVLDSYMAFYLLGSMTGNTSQVTAMNVEAARGMVEELYPTWTQTQKFVRDVSEGSTPKHDLFEFREVAGLVDEIGERYGPWQNRECRSIKDMLVQFEDTASTCAGRVRLSDFYRKVVEERKWQLGDSVEFLSKAGAIDSTDPDDLHVIIPNYLYSPINCVAGSSYYSVCCIDECEGLLLDIERKFARPDVAPEEIAAHVAAMPSSTVPANRTLPAWLLRRLDEVAAYHGGLVPLHGRLFLQWMHHAYPRECRYPHASGDTDPMQTRITSDNYESGSAFEDEMRFYINAGTVHDSSAGGPAAVVQVDGGCGMWTMQEELVVWRPPAAAVGAAVAALPETTTPSADEEQFVLV